MLNRGPAILENTLRTAFTTENKGAYVYSEHNSLMSEPGYDFYDFFCDRKDAPRVDGTVSFDKKESILRANISAFEKADAYIARDALERVARLSNLRTFAIRGYGYYPSEVNGHMLTTGGRIVEYALEMDGFVKDMQYSDRYWRRDVASTEQPTRTHVDPDMLLSTDNVSAILHNVFPNRKLKVHPDYVTKDRTAVYNSVDEIISFREPSLIKEIINHGPMFEGKLIYRAPSEDLVFSFGTFNPSEVLPAIQHFLPMATMLGKKLVLVPRSLVVTREAEKLAEQGVLFCEHPPAIGQKNFHISEEVAAKISANPIFF